MMHRQSMQMLLSPRPALPLTPLTPKPRLVDQIVTYSRSTKMPRAKREKKRKKKGIDEAASLLHFSKERRNEKKRTNPYQTKRNPSPNPKIPRSRIRIQNLSPKPNGRENVSKYISYTGRLANKSRKEKKEENSNKKKEIYIYKYMLCRDCLSFCR